MAQFIALAASAVSLFLTPGLKTKDNNGTTPGGKTGGITLGFSSGITMGLTLGIVFVTQFQKRRIKERIRHAFMKWLYNDDKDEENKENENANESSSENRIKIDESDPINLGEDSIMHIIADCNNTLSSNLHCSKITLKKGTRTVMQKSRGVEVYFILHGSADFMLNDIEHSSVGVNESILVPPWISRIMANNSHDDVILLRVSDAGDEGPGNNANLAVEKIDNRSSFTAIKEGIKTKIGGGISKMGSGIYSYF